MIACTHQPGTNKAWQKMFLLWETRMLFTVRALCQVKVCRWCTSRCARYHTITPLHGLCAWSVLVKRAWGCAIVGYREHLTAGLHEILVSSIETWACYASMASRSCSASQSRCRAASCLIPKRAQVIPRTRLFNTATRCCASIGSISCALPLRSAAMRRNRDPISLWSRMHSFFETLCMMTLCGLCAIFFKTLCMMMYTIHN